MVWTLTTLPRGAYVHQKTFWISFGHFVVCFVLQHLSHSLNVTHSKKRHVNQATRILTELVSKSIPFFGPKGVQISGYLAAI